MSPNEPIAIVGSACRLPGDVNTPSSLWDLLVDPKDLLTYIPKDRFNTQGFYHTNGQYHGHTNVDKSYLLSSQSHNIKQFDAQFFGITPLEANTLDPQVRLLLEAVFEAMEDGGQPMDKLRGSETAVYSGMMISDYEHMMSRDEDAISNHHVTGTARSLMSNRISYFFDWHGPSMTIDTACSSSLYAVHYAVQQLRSGASEVAVATGSNLLLDPLGYIGESKLQMLSPTGRSRMWDAGADGYARGEGVAAVVLKTVAQAEKDGDVIQCVIRETAVNQDGRTRGITVPSARAQSNLIRSCYERAGLNLDDPRDHPQFFEAHGTGTPTGDPIEAEAISSVFSDSRGGQVDPLFVGSIKTVVGHTEGTAGLAGILKASLALRNAVIPPNLLFQKLNPKVEPFYRNLRIPITASMWPPVPDGAPRRASVNSFGFGGANAHAILETYSPPLSRVCCESNAQVFSPFIFSAQSELSLTRNLEHFHAFLQQKGASLSLRELAHTLHSRRTRFSYTSSFSASTISELCSKIEDKIEESKKPDKDHPKQRPSAISADRAPRVIAVFTGQGAQWASMGADILASSASSRRVLQKLDERLASLPDPPSWSLIEELGRDEKSSRIQLAEFSQPLCTAIQILLVDILRAARVPITAVVGHSSGEIAASYALQLISAEDAICIAYYRGLYTRLARKSGGMMAVGSSEEDIQELLDEPEFVGRACIGAVNSSTNVTVSGDMNAIQELESVLKDEKKFARILKVDQAYHSPHMADCSSAYLASLDALKISIAPVQSASWSSSVYGGGLEGSTDSLRGPYWELNLRDPVRFKQAVQYACEVNDPFDLALEIGPHPALKAPFLQNVHEYSGHSVPYTSLLRRGSTGLQSLSDGLGYIAANLGKDAVNFASFDRFMAGSHILPLCQSLPAYAWNHDHEYWHDSRHARAIIQRPDGINELIGHLCPESTRNNMSWRNILRPRELPWLEGHRIQGQIVFPAAGYIVAAAEAALKAAEGAEVSAIEIFNVTFEQALIFGGNETEAEAVVSLTDIQRQHGKVLSANFSFNAAKSKSDSLQAFVSGGVRVWLSDRSSKLLPARGRRATNLLKVDGNEFYDALSRLGYEYTGPFAALTDLERKLGAATGFILDAAKTNLLLHPATLDAAFQSILLAASAPNDGRLDSIHLPFTLRHMLIDVGLCNPGVNQRSRVAFDSFQPDNKSVSGDVDIIDPDSDRIIVQIEDLRCVPLAVATANDDKLLFSNAAWGPLLPDAGSVAFDGETTEAQHHMACQLERVSWFYLRRLDAHVPRNHPSRSNGSYVPLFEYISHAQTKLEARGHPWWDPDWKCDTLEEIEALCDRFSNVIDFRLLHAMGSRIVDIVMGDVIAIEVAMQDNVLRQYYQRGLGTTEYTTYLARIVAQIAFRFPHLECLEIGAGTGGATRAIFQEAKQAFKSYTFTDISSGFFSSAEALFKANSSHMTFKTLDIDKDPGEQGFQKQSYDLIVASLVLHSTVSLTQTLKNIRQLLKPGGYLVVLELQKDLPARWTTIFGCFPGWWIGSDDGRRLSPCVGIEEWDGLLRDTGFSGCDTVTPDADVFAKPLTVFVSQAVDDRVSFLRDPLSSTKSMRSLGLGDLMGELIIIGGNMDHTASLIDGLVTRFRKRCAVIKTARTLQELSSLTISSTSIVLSLVELDGPLYRDMGSPEWQELKLVFQTAGSVLWITSGRHAAKPHSNMLLGALRAARHEMLGLTVQMVDIEDCSQVDAPLLEATLLRFQASIQWQDEHKDIAFNDIERELVVAHGGQVSVQRLLLNEAINDRYNSSRRPIHELVSVRKGPLNLVLTQDGYDLIRGPTVRTVHEGRGVQKIITHSLLTPIRVAGRGPLFLAIGKDDADSGKFLGLSNENSSLAMPETTMSHPINVPDGREGEFLILASLVCLLSDNLSGLEDDDHILVLEPSRALATFLASSIGDKQPKITYVSGRTNDFPNCQKLHPHVPDRDLRTLDLSSVTVFIDLSEKRENDQLVAKLLSFVPTWCKQLRLCSEVANVPPVAAKPRATFTRNVRRCLEKVATSVSSHLLVSEDAVDYPHVALRDVCDRTLDISPRSIVRWTEDEHVRVRVRPVDSSTSIFSANKTYWLVGLTRSLGLSLCEWMVRHGARYVVLSSRAPQVETRWLEEMAALGAVIEVRSCDISVYNDVARVYADICSELPPIGGVAQGAMVLHDANMSDLSFESLQQVTRPKVEGSLHLNQIFQEDNLDFFIFLSSISSTIGIPGQSAYASANLFMTALAEQRRQRGLAASVINIGAVLGAGYITQTGMDTAKTKKAYGFMNLSVSDFHQLFAEAVIADRHGAACDIFAGIGQFSQHEVLQPRWASNPLMTHFILNSQGADEVLEGVVPEASLKTQLIEANNLNDVKSLIQKGLVNAIGALLQLSSDMIESVGPSTRLDEIGIDSILALEIRAWLMENLQFNYPVLQILSGITIDELVCAAASGMSPSLIPKLGEASESSESAIGNFRSIEALATEQGTPVPSRQSSEQPSVAASSDVTDATLDTLSDTTLPSASEDQELESTLLMSLKPSPTQTMFWSALTLFDDKASLNFSALCSVQGRIDVSQMERAVWALGQQHEALRTCFFLDAQGALLQGIMKNSTLKLEREWVENQPDILAQKVEQVRQHTYNAENGELVKLHLISTSLTSHYLLFGASHLCMDGISVRIFLTDLFRHYHRQSASIPTKQFREHAQVRQAELEAGKLDHEFNYWEGQYPDFPPPLPILRVSQVTLRPTLESFKSATVEATISVDTKQRIASACRRCRVTPFHFHLTVFRVLLARLSDVKDVAIGTVDAGRHEDNMGSLGVYANTLPLRFRSDNANNHFDNKFEQLLQETRNVTLAALANASIPFQSVMERLKPPRSASSTPIFQCLVNYRPGQRKAENWGGLDVDLVSLEVSNTGYDLSLDIVDDAGKDCLLTLVVNRDIYTNTEAEMLIGIYKKLIEAFSQQPDMIITEPAIYDENHVASAFQFGLGPSQNLQWTGSIQQRIEEIAHDTPHAIAVKGGGGEQSVTYSQLVKDSIAIASALMADGIAPGSMVATLQEPTADWVATILAIMKVGCIYVPLDLSMPQDRLRVILRDCEARYLILDSSSEGLFEQIATADIMYINVSDAKLRQPSSSLPSHVLEDKAMVLYTSGSTSTPKGIILSHKGISNLIESVQPIYDLDQHTVTLQQSAATFDMCYAQIFMALGHGGSVILLPRHLRGDPLGITEALARQGVTMTNATPTEYSSWLRYGNTMLLQGSSWRVAISGGEHVRPSLLEQFRSLNLATLRVCNSYGPTEITWGVTNGELLNGNDDLSYRVNGISAGFVLPNYTVYLVDEQKNLVPPGISGEIYVGGPGVARGYLNGPTLNTDRFIPDTFAPEAYRTKGWTMMHCTGDTGRWSSNGSLIIEGRIGSDAQVKLRGFRFDLRDVERSIIDAASGSISEAVVSVRRSTQLEDLEFLVAHVVMLPDVDSEEKLRLLKSLPSLLPLPNFMIPAAIFPIQELPRTTSSKLDRQAVASLPLPESRDKSSGMDVELTDVQCQLRDIWLSVIPIAPREEIAPSVDFFHVGGTSLLLVQLQAELRNNFGVDIPLSQLLRASTLGSMTMVVEGGPGPDQIDWEKESGLSDKMTHLLQDGGSCQSVPAGKGIVILTGATGLLGRALLNALIADDEVREVHCLGVREIRSRSSLAELEKVKLHEGDIRQPLLGLTPQAASALFEVADCIIHAAAEISHRQAYPSLRASNVDSLKQLVEMSLPRKIPLHYISTSQVGILYSAHTGRYEFPEISIANCPPAADGLDGYTATKWTCERFLERLDATLDGTWPIHIHRPSLILRPDSPGLTITHNLAKYSSLMGAIPVLPNYQGYLNSVNLETVIAGLMDSLCETKPTVSKGGIKFRHYVGEGEPARLDDLNKSTLPSALGGFANSPPNNLATTFERLPAFEWATRAGTLGLAPEIIDWVKNAATAGDKIFPRLIMSA